MNITSKGRYALRVMLDLAQHPEDGFVSLKTVADRQQISMKYLEAIVGNLKKAELLESTRGKEGGYRLSRPASEITVAEVLHSAEGSLAAVSCLALDDPNCDRAANCLTLPLWRKLDGLMEDYLSGVTVQDVLDGNV